MPQRQNSGLFVPDERCLGGLLEINETYKNMMRTVCGDVSRAPPQGPQPSKSKSTSGTPNAATLSHNRALKRAETDVKAQEHAKNLQHLNRRLAEQGLPRSRGLDAAAATLSRCTTVSRPTSSTGQRSRSSSRPSSAFGQRPQQQQDLKPWAPKPLIRSVTMPVEFDSDDGSVSNSPSTPDWVDLKQRKHPVLDPPVRPVELPIVPSTGTTPLLPSVLYKLYHEALMADVLERELYKEAEIQELCRQYLEVNPLDHRDVLQKVIEDIKGSLDVR